jgi:hypothetical protein
MLKSFRGDLTKRGSVVVVESQYLGYHHPKGINSKYKEDLTAYRVAFKFNIDEVIIPGGNPQRKS